MDKFLMGVAAAQNANANANANAVAGAKSAKRRHPALSIIGGIAITLLVGAGMLVVAALNN
jgi:hypothetical protein